MKKLILTIVLATTIALVNTAFGATIIDNSHDENYTVEEIQHIVDTIPKHLTDNLSITLQYFESPYNKYFSELYGQEINVKAIYNNTAKDIQIYKKTDNTLTRILYHEIGHHVDNIYLITKNGWDKCIEADNEYITTYAVTSIQEDFAESFAEYYINPNNLKKHCPARYGFIDEFLSCFR